MRLSTIERNHLFKAWAAISIAFAIAFSGLSAGFFSSVIVAGLTVGLGFIVHELAHKVVAQRFGCFAEFRADTKMLILAIVVSFTGMVFAAPGAVMISGHVTRRKSGMISLAGPAANIGIALLFLPVAAGTGLVALAAGYGVTINSWLALFNLIPFGNLDGAKVLAWDRRVYAGAAASALIMMLVSSLV
ncbi:MAG: metalloprotease [archaeon]